MNTEKGLNCFKEPVRVQPFHQTAPVLFVVAVTEPHFEYKKHDRNTKATHEAHKTTDQTHISMN